MSAAPPLHQTVAIEHGMDGALCRDTDLAGKSTDELLPDLAGAPMRLLALQGDDGGFDLNRELVPVAIGPASPVAETFQTGVFVPVEDLVTGFAGDSKLPVKQSPGLAIK